MQHSQEHSIGKNSTSLSDFDVLILESITLMDLLPEAIVENFRQFKIKIKGGTIKYNHLNL